MGKILIFVILAVTIPRWALTLRQVDTFSLGGIPVAAIGEAVVLELGNFYLLRIYNKCRARALKYKTDWETLDKQNQEQGKTTRKSKDDPITAGHWILPVILLVLEMLTVIAQTPFIAGGLLDQSAAEMLSNIHQLAVVAYAFLLVVSPGVMTVAIGFGVHYEEALREANKGKEQSEAWSLKGTARSMSNWLTRRIEGTPVIDQPTGPPATEQPASDRPTTRRRPAREEVSETLAGHLVSLKETLTSRLQEGASQNGHFRRIDVEDILSIGSTQAKNVIRYGLDHDILHEPTRHHYAFTN